MGLMSLSLLVLWHAAHGCKSVASPPTTRRLPAIHLLRQLIPSAMARHDAPTRPLFVWRLIRAFTSPAISTKQCAAWARMMIASFVTLSSLPSGVWPPLRSVMKKRTAPRLLMILTQSVAVTTRTFCWQLSSKQSVNIYVPLPDKRTLKNCQINFRTLKKKKKTKRKKKKKKKKKKKYSAL